MSNSKEPVPITSAKHIKKPPEPIRFPAPALRDEQLRTLVCDSIARILYRVATQLDDVEIVTMTEEDFRLFCRKVAEEDA